METSTTVVLFTAMERSFLLFAAIGFALYIYKKWHAFKNWNPIAFWKANGHDIVGSLMLTASIAYWCPDLFLIAFARIEMGEINAMITEHPRIMEKLVQTFAVLLGFTGGSIGFDLIAMLYNLPIVGKYIQQMMEGLMKRIGITPPVQPGVNAPLPPGT